MSQALVTGAAGFIGSHMVGRLLELGHEVVGVDAFTGNYSRERKLRNFAQARLKRNCRLVEGDLLDLDLKQLLRDTDIIIHLAAEPGVRASWGPNFALYLERNVLATQRLLEYLSNQSPKQFIYASSSSVYGPDRGRPAKEDNRCNPASPYGLSKLAAEELIGLYSRERGIPATILRYFTVYGPRQRPEMAISRFISAAVLDQPVEIFGDGEQVREMTYVSDVVDATLTALEAHSEPSPEVYNIGSGSRVTVNQLLHIIQRTLGTRMEVSYGPAAEGDVRSTWAESSKAMRKLGYSPKVSLEEGIAAQIAWARQENSNI